MAYAEAMRAASSLRVVAGLLALALAAAACGSSSTETSHPSDGGGVASDGGPGVGDASSDAPASSGDDAADGASTGGGGDGGDSGASSPRHVAVPGAYNLGMNVPGLNYFNNVAIYADMALALAGNDGPWDAVSGSGAAALDATGAPTVAATTGVTADYPTGAYTVTWDGTGSFAVRGTSSIASLGAAATTSSGGVQHNTATLSFTQQRSTTSTPAWVGFQATPPITNLHVQAPSSLAAPGAMFMSDYLARLQPFSTLRFMDALNTNGNLVQKWSQRTWPSAGSRANTPQGMAYEDIAELAKESGADVWINVPALATDDYVCRLARLLKYGEAGDRSDAACDPSAPAGASTTSPLPTGTTVYVEYSNEIWNWGFQQVEDIYCMVWGVPDKTTGGKHCDVTAPTSAAGVAALASTSLPWSGSGDTYGEATQFTAFLVKRVSDIFRKVFGCANGTGCPAQIPLNVQAAYAAEVEPGLAFLRSAYGSAGAVDLMAVAPYFNVDSGQDGSVGAIFTNLTSSILVASPPSSEGSAIANWLAGDLAEANKYGLPLVAYEGGQGLSGSSASLITAQSDPRMYTAYRTYFALWDSMVGRSHLFNHYDYAGSYGTYGSWGAVVSEYDPGTQKWDALMSLARLPGDANVDGRVDGADCSILKAHFGQTSQWWMQGDFDHDGMVGASDLTAMNANISGAKCVE